MTQSTILQKLLDKTSLNQNEAYETMSAIMNGNVSDIYLSSFLTALKMKGETHEEISGFVRAIRDASKKVKSSGKKEFLDTCGTGGDGKNSINVSTLSAITLASLGVPVAKHGNRSVSSLCGSSDFLDEFGYKYLGEHEEIAQRLSRENFTFLFAPHWHPAMKYAAPVRKELGIRTVFNLLGPLCNPLSPSHQIIGVYDDSLIEVFSKVIISLNLQKAIVCHSRDGYDEFSIFEPTRYSLVSEGKFTMHEFNPEILKLSNIKPKDIFASTRAEAISLSERILKGEVLTGTLKVALNAGVGLFLLDKAGDIPEGFQIALQKLSSGEIFSFFAEKIEHSQQ